MTFDEAFERLIGHEGGLVDDPADPGGLTKYGISRRAYPGENIADMTLERAKAIYKRDYWGPAGCDLVPEDLRFDLFDMAVNSGVRAAIRALQRAVGERPDGVIGPRTLAALTHANPARLRMRYAGARLALMVDLPNWPQHGRGWVRRVAANLMEA